jgi:hypothetical protein
MVTVAILPRDLDLAEPPLAVVLVVLHLRRALLARMRLEQECFDGISVGAGVGDGLPRVTRLPNFVVDDRVRGSSCALKTEKRCDLSA